MKFLIVDSYYQGFLDYFRKTNPLLKNESYDIQLNSLFERFFGTGDYYSYHLKSLGHQAEEYIVNDEILQRRWAEENNIYITKNSLISKLQMYPYIHRYLGRPLWIQQIVIAQIQKFKPDIIYVQDLSILNTDTLKEVKGICKLLVGQIASPLPSKKNLEQFDLILTSFPHFVKRFREMGIKSEYFKIGFETRLNKIIKPCKKIYNVTFIGSFSPLHRERIKFLEEISSLIPIDVWGSGINYLSINSALHKKYHGKAWGLDMYKIIAQSKIVINSHIDVAEDYANNMRLFETTGMGTMLITDNKKNLSDLFETGKEIVVYESPSDLTRKIKYYLDREREREKIAKKGQMRTWKSHSYKIRMEELIHIIKKYL